MTAKMHPHYEDNEIDRKIVGPGAPGERQLYRELRRQLPDSWHVLYNTHIHAGNNDVQTDFLVFCPGKGVVNVDAKGEGYRYKDNVWYLGNDEDDIFYKANRAKSTFNAYVQEHLVGGPWGAYGMLVVFVLADPILPRGPLPGDYHYILPKDVREGRLKECIERELDNAPEKRAAQKYFTPENFRRIQAHFCQKIEFRPVSYEFRENEQRLNDCLTFKQREISAEIERNRYVHVAGGAGTGKTWLAMECAQKFANAQKRVLYVCYNETLAYNLSQFCRHGNITILHYDVIPQRLFNKNLIINDEKSRKPDWERTHEAIANFLFESDLAERKKFDLILVDEAQDMTENMMISLAFLGKEGYHAAYFSDSAQAIFQQEQNQEQDEDPVKTILSRFFEGLKPDELMLNLRNTDRIHQKVIQYSHEKTRPGGLLPGRKPETFNQPIVELVARLINEEGIQPEDIAVLAYHQNTLTEIKPNDRITFTSDFGTWIGRNGKVLKTTVQSFKGLEANVVIIADAPPQIEEKKRDQLCYVGESRARYRLYLHQD